MDNDAGEVQFFFFFFWLTKIVNKIKQACDVVVVFDQRGGDREL